MFIIDARVKLGKDYYGQREQLWENIVLRKREEGKCVPIKAL